MCAQWKLVAPRPWGPGFQPGMWAALWATPLPATESEEGTQAGHQLCRFYQLLTGEGRAREKEKQTQTSSHRPAQMQIFLGGVGSVPRPRSTLPPGLPAKPNSGALRVGNCMFPRMQLVTRTQASSQPLWVAQTLHSPRPGFPLYSPQAGVHTTHSHCRSLACQRQPLGELTGGNVFSLPCLAFQSTSESTGIGWKHFFSIFARGWAACSSSPRTGHSVWPALEAPGGLRLCPQEIVIMVGKACVWSQLGWIVAPGLVSSVISDKLIYFSEPQFPYLATVWQCPRGCCEDEVRSAKLPAGANR